MATGYDARVAASKETVFGTRVAPARFMPLTAEDLGFEPTRYRSPALGTGAWGAPSIITSKVGRGSIRGDVPTTGFGFLLDGLHGNTVTPVQQASTTAYLQTHTLNTAPSKSFSFQVQTPPVTSATLVPHDMIGVMFGGLNLSWSAAGVLAYEIPVVYRELDTEQTNITYVAPTAYDLFSFIGGSLSIAGVAEANIIGDGSLALAWPLRDDAFALGSSGMIAKPVPTDKPSGSGTFVADFNDNTNIDRTLNNETGDVVLLFEGTTIASTYKHLIQVTLPDSVFTTNRPTVGGPGPVQQTVNFQAASATGDPPVITYQSTDTSL